MGINFNRLEEYNIAKTFLDKVISTADFFQHKNQIKSKAYHNLGIANSGLGKSTLALDYFNRSMKLKNKDSDKIITIYLLAKENLQNGNIIDAKNYIMKGIGYSSEYGNHIYQIKFKILNFQLLEETKTGEYGAYLENVAIPFLKERAHSFLCECTMLLGQYYKETFQYKNATRYFELASQYRKELI